MVMKTVKDLYLLWHCRMSIRNECTAVAAFKNMKFYKPPHCVCYQKMHLLRTTAWLSQFLFVENAFYCNRKQS